MAKNIISLTDCKEDVSIVISKANADFGGNQINEYWAKVEKQNPRKYHLYPSLGQMRYLSFMNECYAVLVIPQVVLLRLLVLYSSYQYR